MIYKLRDLLGVDDLGGTMRLGSYACQLKQGSLSQRLYGADVIHERHRHRYEFNCLYEQTLTDKGLQIVGRSLDGKFVEIVELPDPPVVRRGAVPSRVQEQAAPAAPAVRRLRRGRRSATSEARAGRRRLGGTGAGNEYNQRVNIAPVAIGPLTLGAPAPLLFIGGPCVIESPSHALDLGRAIQAIAREVGVPYVFKASFDKANRTSITLVSRPGPGRGPAHRSSG